METKILSKTETGRARSLANLIPAKKGETRNPNGRPPKSRCTTTCLAELLQGDPLKIKRKWDKQGMTGAMVVALALFAKMGRGDVQAVHEGLDRVQGKVTEHTDVTSNGESLAPKPSLIVHMPDGRSISSSELAGENECATTRN